MFAIVVSHMLLPVPCSLRAVFVAVPCRAARAVTKRSAVDSSKQALEDARHKKMIRGQFGTFLVNNPAAKGSWTAFCNSRDLEPFIPLDKHPLEAMEAFLADPASYKQSELIEFLGLDTVNRPLTALHSIEEDDPIAKSMLVRELTLKQVRAHIAEDSEVNRLWNKFWAEKLQAMAGEDEDDARAAMAMKSSFTKRKVPAPGTWEAMVMKEKYHDGRSNVPDFDIDGGKNAIR